MRTLVLILQFRHFPIGRQAGLDVDGIPADTREQQRPKLTPAATAAPAAPATAAPIEAPEATAKCHQQDKLQQR